MTYKIKRINNFQTKIKKRIQDRNLLDIAKKENISGDKKWLPKFH